jgi:hypothetical protein
MVADIVSFKEVKCERLNATTGLFELQESYFVDATEAAGGLAEQALPPNAAYQLRLNRPDPSYRHGYKRLPGVTEGQQSGGSLTVTAYGNLQDVADALELALVAYQGSGTTHTPMTLTTAYIQATQAVVNGDVLPVPRFTRVTNIVPNVTVKHQDTRDYGRGA